MSATVLEYMPDMSERTVWNLLRHPRVLRLSWRPGMSKKRMLHMGSPVGQPKVWVEYVTASTATDVLEKEHPALIGRPRVTQQAVSDYLSTPLRICEDATMWLVFSGQADCGGWMTRNDALAKYDLADKRRGASLWGSKTHGLLVNCVLCKPEHAAKYFMAQKMSVDSEDGATYCVVGEYLECTPVSLGALPREMSQYSSLPVSKMDETDPRYCAMVTVLNQHRAAFAPKERGSGHAILDDAHQLMLRQLGSSTQS